ncbi:MAG: DUF2878 domain-containing protein [Alteromonadales bacterium]|nr:DUF2878 domain-containing protein [Alteromonadales bacterium]
MFIINLLGFDFIWFGLVYWGNIFIPLALLLLGLHIYFISNTKLKEIYLICAVASIGILVDSALQYFGVFIFPQLKILPLWLITLWFCFAATLCHSLKILQSSKLLQWLVGAFLAPISYLGGNELSAVTFGLNTVNTFVLLSFLWGALMIIFFHLKAYLVQEEPSYV